MRDALRSCLAAAGGRTEVPRRRAAALAKALLAQGAATAEQVSVLTEELLETGPNSRAALVKSPAKKLADKANRTSGQAASTGAGR